jgi:hypothetical protein
MILLFMMSNRRLGDDCTGTALFILKQVPGGVGDNGSRVNGPAVRPADRAGRECPVLLGGGGGSCWSWTPGSRERHATQKPPTNVRDTCSRPKPSPFPPSLKRQESFFKSRASYQNIDGTSWKACTVQAYMPLTLAFKKLSLAAGRWQY